MRRERRRELGAEMKFEVLIAEDDELVRLTMREALESAGYSVEAVADGQEAMARFAEKRFDIVISDVRMPKVNGAALFQHIRKHAPATAVMLVTAHGNVNDAVEALKAGVDDYVTKPFDIAELLIRIERLAARLRLTQELGEARATLAGLSPGSKLYRDALARLPSGARRPPSVGTNQDAERPPRSEDQAGIDDSA